MAEVNTTPLVLSPRVTSQRINQCKWAMAKAQLGNFHALKIYQNPIGRSFLENKNLHFLFEHVAGDYVLSQTLPGSFTRRDLVAAHPPRVPAPAGLPPERAPWEGHCLPGMLEFQLSFCLIIVELGSHKIISSFADGAPSVLSDACLLWPFLFSRLSSWHLLRNPLILASVGQPFALRCNEKLPA